MLRKGLVFNWTYKNLIWLTKIYIAFEIKFC